MTVCIFYAQIIVIVVVATLLRNFRACGMFMWSYVCYAYIITVTVVMLVNWQPYDLNCWPLHHCVLRLSFSCHDPLYFIVCVFLDGYYWHTWKFLFRGKTESYRHSRCLPAGPTRNLTFLYQSPLLYMLLCNARKPSLHPVSLRYILVLFSPSRPSDGSFQNFFTKIICAIFFPHQI